MRIALLSPYSWTYPGGVTRHIEALARELRDAGHETRILAPFDPDDGLTRRLHRGARPQRHPAPEGFVPLGRTVGIPANGAVTNMTVTPGSLYALRRELRGGDYDVLHIHEPVVPVLGWDALLSAGELPLVGTFHTYSENALTNGIAAVGLGGRRRMNRLHVRIAVSEAAAWTLQRFYGGRYRIVPNGVRVPSEGELSHAAASDPGAGEADGALGIVFVGQAVERKGLPVLLRAFEALREHVPATLTLVGASAEEVAHMKLEDRGVRALGKVSEARKLAELARADVLCAPSLGGESFGMVLTEAFAAATPVLASNIPGYRDVLRDGLDGVLVPAGDPVALAQALARLALDPTPPPLVGRERRLRTLRRAALTATTLAGGALGGLALQRVGVTRVAASLVASKPGLIAAGLALMCAAMFSRAISWHAILAAAPTWRRAKRRDAMQGTFIGVLMSATLPARLGEPSRALIVARRIGRARETLPIVLGTMVSQTMLNLLALLLLGAAGVSSVSVLDQHDRALLVISLVPLAVLIGANLAPVLVPPATVSRSRRAQALLAAARRSLVRLRDGLRVFGHPRRAALAAAAQLSAWALQWLACWLLLIALGLNIDYAPAAAAGVLFVVNVTSVVPATPANVGVFQAACVAVLAGAYHVSTPSAIAYGIVLQAVELATALIMGLPALLNEGLSWREVRLRTIHAAPIELGPLPQAGQAVAGRAR